MRMDFCGFCAIKMVSLMKIEEHKEYLNIFKSDLVAFARKDTFICAKCLQQLQNCYDFVQQIQKSQQQFKEFLQQQERLQMLNKQRLILPKPIEARQQESSPIIASTSQKRIYKCSECAGTFNAFRQLKTHELTHSITNNANICKYCCSLYANAEALQQHLRDNHDDERYVCNACKKSYKNKGHLIKHLANEHHCNTLIFNCTLCPQSAMTVKFHSRHTLEAHFRDVHLLMSSSHVDNVDDAADDVNIDMNEEFLDEFLLGNTNENSFQFSECWEALDLQLADMLHLHSDDKQNASAFKCPKCYENCDSQKILLLHLASKHEMNVLSCSKCEISFQDLTQLTQHKVMHRLKDKVLESATQCGICDKTFKTNAALNYHIKTHSRTTTRPHECPFCGKCFHADVNMKQHIRIVHRQLKRHICQLCDKQFTTLDHLKKHVLSQHQNERKHICDICAKRFTQLSHLKQHRAIHTTGKTLQCSLCQATFWRKIDLERHTLNKHEKM